MLRYSKSLRVIARQVSSQSAGNAKDSPKVIIAPKDNIPKVVGLSTNCVKINTGPVGPGAAVDAKYKVPEYFSFDRFSFAEAEVEMAKYRCPQPSSVKK